MTKWPEWAVVIPTKDRRDLLEKALLSLDTVVEDAEYEVIVVDTADGGLAFGPMPHGVGALTVIDLPGATFAQACNAGVKQTQAASILLMNDDIILTTDPLAGMRPWLEGNPAGIVGARLIGGDGTLDHAGIGFDLAGNPYQLWKGAPAEHPEAMKRRYLTAVTFALAGITRTCWECLGGLDERYQNAYEDLDFCLRAKEDGHTIAYDPSIVAVHLGRQSAGRHDHDAEAWQVFRERWADSGRLAYATGVWPFQMERLG